MHQAVIYIDPTGPAPIGFMQAAGMPGDIRFDFKTQANLAYPNVASLFPQLVLRPFTDFGVKIFDIEINDPTGSSGIARVPGVEINDKFHAEVYSRNENGSPQRMLAVGRLELNGYSYGKAGPLGPASYPEGPAGPTGAVGPVGPPGEQGVRGSRWYTGAGDPVAIPDVRVLGDMYLDEDTGAVWRWDGAAWMGFSVKA